MPLTVLRACRGGSCRALRAEPHSPPRPGDRLGCGGGEPPSAGEVAPSGSHPETIVRDPSRTVYSVSIRVILKPPNRVILKPPNRVILKPPNRVILNGVKDLPQPTCRKPTRDP